MRRTFFILFFFSWLLTLSAQRVTISGFVSDFASGETLTGASIRDSISLSGGFTNNNGFFSITLGIGYKTLQVSYVGYGTKTVKLYLRGDTSVIFQINSGIELEEVHVVSAKTESDFSKGRLTIPMVKLQEIPAILGEADLIKSLQTFPGIAPPGEGSSGIIVRGGGSDQNLFILDGIQVYNTGHLFNFISIFNPEAIKKVDFYKCAFPSKYGGRLSSVTDVTFRDGNRNQIKGSFDIGLINSKLTLEGPINQKTTFLFALRSTYFDLFTPIRNAIVRNKQKFQTSIEPYNDETVLYTFADLNLKVNHKINNNNSVAFNLYSGVDYYRIFNKYELQNERDKYTLLNNVASFKSTHIINYKLFAFAMIGFTSNSGISKHENTLYHKYTLKDPITGWLSYSKVFESTNKAEQKSYIRDISSSIDFSYYSGNMSTLNFGMSGIKHFYQSGIYSTLVIDTIDNKIPSLVRFNNKAYSAFEGSVYVEEELKLKNIIQITAGARLNLFNSNKTFISIDPRISISATISHLGSFVFAYSRMTQNSHALLRNDLLMYKTVWVPSLSGLPPEESDQFSLGFNKKYERGYSVLGEAFYKTMKNLIEYNINYLSQYAYYDWEKSLNINGEGEAYGIELTGEKTKGVLTANINYTLSWNNRKFSDLNNGKWFPYIFDRRHVLNFSGAVRMNKSWKLSFLWTISSGHRINFPIAYINQNPYSYGYFVYDGINTRMLPVYHRLDLGAEWQKKTKKGEPFGFRFSLYNAYYRLNAYYVYVDHIYLYDNNGEMIGSKATVKKKTLLPIIPSINFFYRF